MRGGGVKRPKNVFVLGHDERNLALIRQMTQPSPYRFLPLLDKEEAMYSNTSLDRLLELAQRRLDDFREPIDGIVGYWDFPVSSMIPVLAARYGLPGPSLESVVKCEHKFWSRLVQHEVTDAHPRFATVDPDNPHTPLGLTFPLWLKPVKSYSSALAFKVDDAAQLRAAATEIRAGMGHTGEDFDCLLSTLNLPPALEEAGGTTCLAEEAVCGRQITVEGYVYQGRAHVHGVIDSLCYPDSSSFLCYQYPSRIPEGMRDRAMSISRNVIEHIGLNSSTFNIEFFCDTETDALNILEINPRLSQSHAPLFELVDGVPNHHAMVRVAVGDEPHMPHRQGDHRVAAKWFRRTFRDGLVKSTPSKEDLARVRQEIPDATVDIIAEEGKQLSDLPAQDSYSYELFAVYVGGKDENELRAKFDRCVELLPFDLDST